MKLESLSLEKFKKNEIKNLRTINGGGPIDTGCSDAPDCSTGTDGSDSTPFDPMDEALN